ncbi:unnamed protein product [Brassica rapa subsp. narinosa]
MHLSRFMVVAPFSLQQETACPRPELANHTQGSSHWLFASTKHLLDAFLIPNDQGLLPTP